MFLAKEMQYNFRKGNKEIVLTKILTVFPIILFEILTSQIRMVGLTFPAAESEGFGGK